METLHLFASMWRWCWSWIFSRETEFNFVRLIVIYSLTPDTFWRVLVLNRSWLSVWPPSHFLLRQHRRLLSIVSITRTNTSTYHDNGNGRPSGSTLASVSHLRSLSFNERRGKICSPAEAGGGPASERGIISVSKTNTSTYHDNNGPISASNPTSITAHQRRWAVARQASEGN